jgi:glycosyltransferase 2 family protein
MKKRLISIALSLLILVFIYWKIDFRSLLQVFQQCHWGWMIISLGMVVPITLLTAWRLQQLMPRQVNSRRNQRSLTFVEANRLILAASSLNMVLPSKMGDIVKAYFMQQRGHLSGSLALSLVIFEKTYDMLSLLLWCAFGLLLYPQKDGLFWIMTIAVVGGLAVGALLLGSRESARLFFAGGLAIAPKSIRPKLTKFQTSWREMHDYFWQDLTHLIVLTATSIAIWFLHLLQIWLFILALNAWTPFLSNLALSPLAILAGLLPLTFAGVGTRDAALILFYQPYFSAAIAAALGLLCTSRYVMPAIAGLPFLGQYLVNLKQIRQQMR